MTNTEIALHLIRCGTLTVSNPRSRSLIFAGLAEVKRGRLTLTKDGHAVLRGK